MLGFRRHPLAHLVPDRGFALAALDKVRHGSQRAAALEAAYAAGYCGCFLPTDGGVQSAIAEYDHDEFFHDNPATKLTYSDVDADLPDAYGDGLHIYTGEAFEAWGQHGENDRLPFTIRQDYGDCVDAQNIESIQQMLGVRASDTQFAEVFKVLAAFYAYSLRGYCGHGWTMSSVATVNNRIGWCPAIVFAGQVLADGLVAPDKGLDYDDEDDAENKVARSWCRTGPPQWLVEWTSDHFAFENGAHVYFDGGLDAAQKLFAAKGGLQTGSNTTGGGRAFSTRRIGGHAQFAFGMAWDAATCRFYRDRFGRDISPSNPVVLMGQTWGEWSGSTPSSEMPDHWPSMPQGVWIIDWQQYMRYMNSRSFAILPKMQGIPSGPKPPLPPPDHPQLTGNLHVDGRAIEGQLTLQDQWEYIIVPDGDGGDYKPIPKPVL